MTKKIVISNQKLSQNPLFWPGQGSITINSKKSHIFLGGGLCTPTRLSQAVPFDILGFILSAEFIKQQIPNAQVFLLIADQHAWLANQFTQAQIKPIANQLHQVIKNTIKAFNLKNWQIFLASNLFKNLQVKSYQDLEKRDINHFFKHHHCGIKLGWQFSPQEKIHHTDEAHFDKHTNLKPLISIMTKPGMTFDAQKPHESPYICTAPKTRIIIHPKENVKKKIKAFEGQIPAAQLKAVKKHLKRITILFNHLIKPFPPTTPLEAKVQQIINQII